MIEVDGSRFSGSGTIVRQAVAFSALTGQPVHVVNARVRRTKPGLRHQHIRVVESIRELVEGEADGLTPNSLELTFRPGRPNPSRNYHWDIGSAGSTTMLALAILPVLAFAGHPVKAELRGGLFQDFAPSFFHLRHVILPLLERMGIGVTAEMIRPGYVPKGEGILTLSVQPAVRPAEALTLDQSGPVQRLWGIALSSHLAERRVSERMAQAAIRVLAASGYRPEIQVQNDATAPQPGAALALFADLEGAARLGADQAGAVGRPAEAIGRGVARRLSEDLASGATLDRFAADQIIPFAALAEGVSRFRVPFESDHLMTNAWLAQAFLGAEVRLDGHALSIAGIGFRPATA